MAGRAHGSSSWTPLVFAVVGEGWGKSALAHGYVARGFGLDLRTTVVQFVKGPDWHPGVRDFARRLGAEWHVFGRGASWASKGIDMPARFARLALAEFRTAATSGERDLVVADEIGFALDYGWVDEQDVVDLLIARDAATSVILTGTSLPRSVLDACDAITTLERTRDPLGRPLFS